MGLAPSDDMAGPLLIDYLYEQERILERQFAVLLANDVRQPSMLTLGGYEKLGGQMYDKERHSIAALRIGGSFHWQLPAGRMGFNGRSFTLS